jgi:predicted Rossmann fold flavoprotein
MLEAELIAVEGEVRLNCKVDKVNKSERFQLQTNQGTFECSSLVIASGGLSFPKIGATDFGYRIAKQFGINLVQTRPGLVPLTFQSEEQSAFGQLSGISVDALASVEGISFREHLLFTHRGLSGPSILQISSYRTESGPIELNLLPDVDVKKWLVSNRQANKELKTLLTEYLPQRLATEWCGRFVASKPMHRYSNVELDQVAEKLQHWRIEPGGTEGYAKAEVTLGGVDTSELSSKTMESRKVPGLYFIGEVVDVTGWLGGYNFQWAWASGHAAGQFV